LTLILAIHIITALLFSFSTHWYWIFYYCCHFSRRFSLCDYFHYYFHMPLILLPLLQPCHYWLLPLYYYYCHFHYLLHINIFIIIILLLLDIFFIITLFHYIVTPLLLRHIILLLLSYFHYWIILLPLPLFIIHIFITLLIFINAWGHSSPHYYYAFHFHYYFHCLILLLFYDNYSFHRRYVPCFTKPLHITLLFITLPISYAMAISFSLLIQ